MKDHLSDREIKRAVHELCMAMAVWDASPAVPYQPSERFSSNLNKMLLVSEKRMKRKNRILKIAACFAALIIAFSVACAVSPTVWAAVRSWYVNIVSPDRLIYEFNHEENDHAFLVVRPDSLPEGFELTDLDEGDGYSNQTYTNESTGEYLKFSYHWATVGELKKLEKLKRKYGTVSIFNGNEAVSYSQQGLSTLTWYDKYSQITYWAESDLSVDDLASIFAESIEMHPPLYEPTWLPEGFVVCDIYVDKGGSTITYFSEKSEVFIIVSCDDQGETERVFVDGRGESKEVAVNGNKATVYWGEEPVPGTVLVMVDETIHMVFVIDTDVIDPELVIKIAESLEVVESFSMNE